MSINESDAKWWSNAKLTIFPCGEGVLFKHATCDDLSTYHKSLIQWVLTKSDIEV